jgi:hypothetical protein
VSSLPSVASKSARKRSSDRRAHVDQAAERVRAVARALRPAQHLDAVDVEQRADAAEPREVDVVDDEADRRVRRAVVLLELADAAQLEVARARAFAGEIQVRNFADRFLRSARRSSRVSCARSSTLTLTGQLGDAASRKSAVTTISSSTGLAADS